MMRARLQFLLSSALLAACGGNVAGEPVDDSGVEDSGVADTVTADAVLDTLTPSDTMLPPDTRTPPPDTGTCTPIPDNTACNEKVSYPCGLPFELDAGTPSPDECRSLCAPVKFTYTPPVSYCSVTASGGGSLVYCSSCAIGRKPSDLLGVAGPCEGEDPVGTALAEMARIEAASVHAFRRLERSLADLGADTHLRARARRAARDEIAHARLAARIAKSRGARPRPVRLAKHVPPTTFELALENAVAGCVHETLGVAYLEHQRTHATDPELRALADALYEDELDHAALSWDLIAFFDQHLTAEERAELRSATERALDEVVEEIGHVHPEVRSALGLPSRAVVANMVGSLRETLFAA